MTQDATGGVQLCRRRPCLGAAIVLRRPGSFRARAEDQADDPSLAPPQAGDHFVFLTGPKKGQPVRATIWSWAARRRRPIRRTRKALCATATPLNIVILVRVGNDGLNDETRERSADGVVAYSGVCTHQACPVNQWSTEKKAMVCSCHGSTYDPKNSAEVIFGPAPRRLAALPLKSENGLLIVAGGFAGRVGMQTN